MIYLDNAATTKVYAESVEAMTSVYSIDYFNPSSTYKYGLEVKKLITDARKNIADHFSVLPCEIYFTSCATEANNWIINNGFKNKKGNIVVSAGEHACVYECAKNLKSKGFDVRFAKLLPSGAVDIYDLLSKVDENTCLVSVIHVSNETGVINDLKAISVLVKAKNPKVILHSDGVQAFLKINTDLKSLGVDAYSISGHKIGAPKGVGALYLSSKVKIQPYFYGGGQESGMRSGTENVAGIIGLSKSASVFAKNASVSNVEKLRRYVVEKLSEVNDVVILGDGAPVSNYIVTFYALGTKAEILQTMCADKGVLIGRGSACSSRHSGNRVLAEMGLKQKEIDGAIRISLCPEITFEDVEKGLAVVIDCIGKLREHKIG